MSHHFILSIKSKRRQLDPECEFFLAANVERYNSFRKRKPSADSWVDDSSTTSDFLVEYTFKCVEAGCCQEFMSIRKVFMHCLLVSMLLLRFLTGSRCFILLKV